MKRDVRYILFALILTLAGNSFAQKDQNKADESFIYHFKDFSPKPTEVIDKTVTTHIPSTSIIWCKKETDKAGYKRFKVKSPVPFNFFVVGFHTNELSYSPDLFTIKYRVKKTKGYWSDWEKVKGETHPTETPSKLYWSEMIFVSDSELFDHIEFELFSPEYISIKYVRIDVVNILSKDPNDVCKGKITGHDNTTPKGTKGCPQPYLIPRSGWCGSYTACQTPSYVPTLLVSPTHVLLHHGGDGVSYTDSYALIRSYWYTHVYSNGWDDIGYNYVVDKYGNIFLGRYNPSPSTQDVKGAHAVYSNSKSIGVSLLGNTDIDNVTSAQETALENLLAWWFDWRGLDPATVDGLLNQAGTNTVYIPRLSGHRDVNSTICPGNNAYNLLPAFRAGINYKIAACSGTTVSNDNCPGYSLNVNSSCSYTNGTTVGATSTGFTSCSGNMNDDDVFYYFNTGSATSVTVQIQGLGNFDPAVQVLTGPCGSSMQQIPNGCIDVTAHGGLESRTFTGLSANTTYYLRIGSYDAGTSNQGDFQVCVYGSASQPDLLITSGTQSASQTSVTAGSNITVYAAEDNSGTISAQSGTAVGIWLTAGAPLITGNATYLGAITGYPSIVAGSSSILKNTTVTIPSGTTAGTYYIFFWADGGGCTTSCSNCSGVVNESEECNNFASCTINVICSAPAPANSISGNSSVCAGSPLVLTVNGTLANGATWKWYADYCGGINIGSGSSVTVYPSSSTIYYLRAESACGNSICVSKSINVYSIPNAPNPTISANTVCQGSNVTLYANTTVTTYSWSGPNGFNSTSQNPGFTANSNSAGQYCLTVTQNGCQSPSGCTYLFLNPSPSLSFYPVNPGFCQGQGPVTVTATGATSYSWTPSNGLSSTTVSNPLANPNSTTTYTVTGTSNGCTGSASITVTVNPPASISATPANPSYCTGSNGVQINAAGGSGNNYIWTPATGLSNANIANPLASPASNTTYTVTGANSNGCSGSATVSVAVHNPPALNITPSNPTICTGGSIQLFVSGANTYSWSPSSGLNTTSGSVVTANPTGIGPHTYTVTGTDVYGCTNTSTVTVTATNSPAVTVSANIQPPYCQGQTVILTPSITGASYLWTPTNQTTNSIGVSSTGTYSVAVTNPSGCTGTYTSAPLTVTINQNPTVPVISVTPNPACAGQAVSFSTSSPGPGYTWSGPNGFHYTVQNPPTINSVGILSTGNYTLTVTNTEGCSAVSNVINLVVNDTNVTITGDPTVCSGQYDTLTATQGTSYLWAPGGQTTQSVYVNSSGVYTVTVTNPNFCSGAPRSAFITVSSSSSPPVPAISITNAGNGHINLVASPSTGYNYQWYLNMTGISQPISGATGDVLFNADLCGYYLIEITDLVSGCASASGQVYCPVGMNEFSSKGSIFIYPNPTHDQLNISGEGLKNGTYEITMTDLLGQQLMKSKAEVSNDKVSLMISIEQLSTGIYFLNIRSEKFHKTFKVEKL